MDSQRENDFPVFDPSCGFEAQLPIEKFRAARPWNVRQLELREDTLGTDVFDD